MLHPSCRWTPRLPFAEVAFTKAGTYRFTTKPGEDYEGMAMKPISEDNVLHLTVTVS